MSKRLNRRRFLQTTAAGVLAAPLLNAADVEPSPNERLHVGVIGVSNRGAANLAGVAGAGAEVVALCDVDEKLAGSARMRFAKAAFYTDFRKLLEQKGLDAVVVSTPDHMHAIPTLMALRAGLHVYCEKPLAHTVEEARLVAETAARTKRVTQMGTQVHAENNYRRVVELIQSDAIGPVQEVHVWVAKVWGGGNRPADTPAIPATFHYDLWLGPAPQRPYHPTYMPANWRRWWDFGGGTLNDMACHYMDLPFWALQLRHPTKIVAEGPPLHAETAAESLTVKYDFPARGKMPPVRLTWYDGGRRPPHFTDGKLPAWGDGVLFVGSKGMLLTGYSKYKLLPEKEFEGFKPPEPSLAASIGHHKEWVAACKKQDLNGTTCNFDYSGALSETVLLGTVAYRAQKPILWDGKALKADVPEAERFIRKEYRKGWSLS